MTTMAVARITINLLYKSTVSRQCNNSHALSIVYSILSRLFTVYTLDCLQYTAIPSPAVVGTLQMLFMDVFR